jgi:hypothetical protein
VTVRPRVQVLGTTSARNVGKCHVHKTQSAQILLRTLHKLKLHAPGGPFYQILIMPCVFIFIIIEYQVHQIHQHYTLQENSVGSSVPMNVTKIRSSVPETDEPKLRSPVWLGHWRTHRGAGSMWHCRVRSSVIDGLLNPYAGGSSGHNDAVEWSLSCNLAVSIF